MAVAGPPEAFEPSPASVAAAAGSRERAGEGLATQRIGLGARLRAVDALLSGTHERREMSAVNRPSAALNGLA